MRIIALLAMAGAAVFAIVEAAASDGGPPPELVTVLCTINLSGTDGNCPDKRIFFLGKGEKEPIMIATDAKLKIQKLADVDQVSCKTATIAFKNTAKKGDPRLPMILGPPQFESCHVTAGSRLKADRPHCRVNTDSAKPPAGTLTHLPGNSGNGKLSIALVEAQQLSFKVQCGPDNRLVNCFYVMGAPASDLNVKGGVPMVGKVNINGLQVSSPDNPNAGKPCGEDVKFSAEYKLNAPAHGLWVGHTPK
jgi:hypothetical protein